MNKWKKTLLIVIISVFILFVIYVWLNYPISKSNPLCDLAAKNFKMQCVQLASPSLYDRGAFIPFSEANDNLIPLAFPEDQILAESCLLNSVEDAELVIFRADPNKSVVFGKHTFNINKNIALGADLNIPEAAGFTIKAGPRITQARTITLEADNAIFFNIDSSLFKSILNSCNIKRSCVSNAKDINKRVIKQLLVAKKLRYVVATNSGESFPLSVALERNMIDIGTKVDGDTVTTRDLSTGIDMVFAVNFFDPQEFQGVTICERDIIEEYFSGRTVVSAMAGSNAPDEKQSQNDEGVVAESIYDIPDRLDSESYQASKAMALGQWSFDNKLNTVELFSEVVTIPGLRWDFFNEPAFKRSYAEAQASVKHTFEVVMISRAEETKTLIAELTSNIYGSLGKNAPDQQYLKVFEIENNRGKTNKNILWKKSDRSKRFDLGQFKPGEKIKVKIEREFKSSAYTEDEGGTLREDLKIRFFFDT